MFFLPQFPDCVVSLTGIVAIGAINEAIDKGDPMITLQTLQMPTAKLHNVNEKEAIHYQAILDQEKKKKQEV